MSIFCEITLLIIAPIPQNDQFFTDQMPAVPDCAPGCSSSIMPYLYQTLLYLMLLDRLLFQLNEIAIQILQMTSAPIQGV